MTARTLHYLQCDHPSDCFDQPDDCTGESATEARELAIGWVRRRIGGIYYDLCPLHADYDGSKGKAD